MPPPSLIRVERSDRIATVIVDRPEKLNALNVAAVRELGEIFDGLGSDGGVRGIVVTGAGEKAFAAGADLAEVAGLSPAEIGEAGRRGQEAFLKIESSTKPVVAAIGGHALGGGCELALACHLRIASENASLGLPEVRLGLIPGYGGTVRLARIVGVPRALEMILTGQPVGADRALEIGLVHAVVPRERLLATAREWLDGILANGPLAVGAALESVRRALDLPSEDAYRLESSLFEQLASSRDAEEGIRAFLERRKPAFHGR